MMDSNFLRASDCRGGPSICKLYPADNEVQNGVLLANEVSVNIVLKTPYTGAAFLF